jgi:hypothetical protein
VLIKPIYMIADATLFIYLMHIPIMLLLKPTGLNGFGVLLVTLGVCVGFNSFANWGLRTPFVQRLRSRFSGREVEVKEGAAA